MPEIWDATSVARKERVSFCNDMKSEVLRKLQGRIYFEKILSATSSAFYRRHSKLALPSWFIQKHGDKFQKAVILRTESATKPWDVNLTITRGSLACAQVKFSGGWKAFATFYGLQEGDSLDFSLTAMSEFEVYIFPGTVNPKRCRSQGGPREWFDESEPSRKKAKQEFRGNTYEQVAAERGAEGTLKSNGLVVKKKAVGEERAVSASGHGSTLCSLASNSEDLHYFKSGMIRFEKTVTASNVPKFGKCTLALPSWFVDEHGDKFQKSVILWSEASTKSWDVNLTVECRSLVSNQVKFSGGWKAFATFHGLLVGDSLIFALTAMSEFEVYIFPGTRNRKRCPSPGGPRKCWDGSELSRRKAKQSYERKGEGLFAEKKEVGGE